MTNVLDYLTKDERKRIAAEAFREMCLEKFRADDERIFSNAAYHAVWKIVDEQFDGKAAEMIAEKIPVIIEELSSYSVFRQPNRWEATSVALQVLDQCVRNNTDAIDAAVKTAAESITKQDIMDTLLEGEFKVSVGYAK